jgi:hypothetical protein
MQIAGYEYREDKDGGCLIDLQLQDLLMSEMEVPRRPRVTVGPWAGFPGLTPAV